MLENIKLIQVVEKLILCYFYELYKNMKAKSDN